MTADERRRVVLVALARGGWLTVREVADATGLARGRVYPAIFGLAAEGAVEGRRRADAGERRHGTRPTEYRLCSPGQ